MSNMAAKAIKVRFNLGKPPEWIGNQRERGWTADVRLKPSQVVEDHRHLLKEYEKFKRLLLDIAGFAVCLHREDDLSRLLDRGKFFRGYHSISAKGESSRCHANSASLWVCNPSLKLVTGYALSRDGLWRQHSWCVRKDGRVIETTTKRILYYGFEMTFKEARSFSDDNW